MRSPEWFQSWGLNHLIMYGRAMQCEQCVNFKDALLQCFAGELFLDVQDVGNDVFNTLPVPTPSGRASGGSRSGGPVSMAAFNYADGGCFAGDCLVEMADGGRTRVDRVRAGDVVAGGHRVACVVRTAVGRPVPMVWLPGLCITPWHPVRPAVAGEWAFPAELAARPGARAAGCRSGWASPAHVYNFALETGHCLAIGGYEACTLGHGFDESAVVRHAYYGTARVIEDLKSTGQWAAGRVELTLEDVQRGKAGLVTGMRRAAPAPARVPGPSSEAPPSPVSACV